MTTNATEVSIDNGVGSQLPSGTATVHPTATTTYTLTATGAGGSATKSITVTVVPVTPPPNVFVSSYPSGMLQSPGSPLPTDRYTLTNLGGTDTTITLSQTGSFFTQTPASFNLPASSSAVVFITATTQPAASYQGSSNVSGSGVASGGLTIPIALLVAAPPASPVTVTPDHVRTDLTAPAGQNPTGSVSFTNPGTSTVQGLVVADVPWIVVPTPAITLGPGETKQVLFVIDRSRRPDASAPIGGATGSLSFRYVNTATGKAEVLGTTITSSVSVSIVDVVTLNVAPGTPAALGPGEVAVFLSGVSSKLGTTGDLVLSNRIGFTISDLKMYFSPAGSSAGTQVSSIPQFAGQTNIAFPGVVKNIFGSQTGTLQFRSSQLLSNGISVVGTRITSALGQNYVTALPLSRSDRGSIFGDPIFLPGVQKSATQTTSLYVQELTGNSATLTIDFIDASGNVLPSSRTSDTLTPFGSLELPDVVPLNAVNVRVTNTSLGPAKISAYALVLDSSTNDAFAIVQVGPPTDPMFCPAFGSVSGAGRDMFINLANASGGAITVTVTTLPAGAHRRAMAHSLGEPLAGSPTTVTIPGNGYKQVRVTDTGVVRVAGSSAVRVAGMYSVTNGGGSFGSGVAAIPTTRALPYNSIKRFAGIDDASANTVAAARPLTYRNNLMLAETSGQVATVRLTLRYAFAAGALVSAGAVISKDFQVPAGGFILINDVVQSVIGSQRTYFGDLHNASLDVSVVDGTGSTIIPFLQVIDNGTGEVTLRTD